MQERGQLCRKSSCTGRRLPRPWNLPYLIQSTTAKRDEHIHLYRQMHAHSVWSLFPSSPLPLLSLSFSSLTSVDGKNRHPLNDFFHCQHRQIAAVVFSIDEPVVTRRVCCSVLKSYWWKIVVTTAMWTKSVMCVIIMAIGRSVKRDNSYLVTSFCRSTFRQKWMELSHRKRMFFPFPLSIFTLMLTFLMRYCVCRHIWMNDY